MSDDEMTGQPPLEPTAEAATAPEAAAEPETAAELEAEDPNEAFLRTFNAIGNTRQVAGAEAAAATDEPAAAVGTAADGMTAEANLDAVDANLVDALPAGAIPIQQEPIQAPADELVAATAAPAVADAGPATAEPAATAAPVAPPAPTWQPFFMAPAAEAAAPTATATAPGTQGAPALSIVPAPGDDAAAAPTGRLGRAGTKARPLALTMATLALFTAGVAGGVALAYARSAPSPVPTTSEVTGESPTSVQEVEAALRSNDADRIRVSIDPEPFSLLEGALAAGSISHVTDVQELGTIVDGNRSATALIIRGVDLEGTPLVVPLNVHTTDGIIETFR